MRTSAKTIRSAVDNLNVHLEGAVLSYLEKPEALFKNACRITVPVGGKPNHFVALTLTAIEFIKLEEVK